ncbi:Acidic phosphoprotein precursor PCEMA1, putative [Plasmodium chabaudi adami]|uniref:Acidic phosphoprotein PCEMA1, putative n=1 Tax=Plasmodium chabaudi adami TaxID=5826 RepID=A0A1C6WM86_PLACE|nr:Acidic phosphoprotein precursor PCEMA1, putative [Plasmodium chabaudi adami]
MNIFYIQIVLFLLTISLYVNNEILATEVAPGEDTKPQSKNPYATDTPEEIYEKNKELLCTNPKEIKQAVQLMNEAVEHLENYATNKDSFEKCKSNTGCRGVSYYKKKLENNTNILKANYKLYGLNMYNELINIIWDPQHAKFFNNGSSKRKVARVYDPNLIIIQQRYKKKFGSRQKYFYALAKRAEISEDKTIIVMTSANINDGNPSKDEYKNTIIESANLFKIDIDPDDDIKNGKLKKVFVNIVGYLIEKKGDNIEIVYIESIDGYNTFKQK